VLRTLNYYPSSVNFLFEYSCVIISQILFTMGEILNDPRMREALDHINGRGLERRIKELVSIGNVGKGGSRLVLSPPEKDARLLVAGWMTNAGMKVHEHPLALIGTYPGIDNNLAPVSLGSHFDTVPVAGRYDGPAGTIGAISAVEAFNESGLRFPRPLLVLAMTGEESSRFYQALLGSRALTHGLTEEDLLRSDSSGTTLAQAITDFGFNPDSSRKPYLTSTLHAFLEMHIEQAATLADSSTQIGAVTAIAATNRQKILLGEGSIPKVDLAKHTDGVRFTVNGQAGHSGGTPMGRMHRADGLVPTAQFLEAVAEIQRYFGDEVNLHIVEVDVEGQALNKIPGTTTTTVLLSGDDPSRVANARHSVTNSLDCINDLFSRKKDYPKFNGHALSIAALGRGEIPSHSLFDPRVMMPIYQAAGGVILTVHEVAEQFREYRIVGTVGTFRQLDNGRLELGIDLRGVDSGRRRQALGVINRRVTEYAGQDGIASYIDPLSSIQEASIMDPKLVALVENSAKALGFRTVRMHSGPGHDAQNFVDLGVPTGMVFIPSRKGGGSHIPEEYSTARDLENGTRVLALTTAELASS